MTTETDYTDDDVTRLTGMVHPLRVQTTDTLARRLLEQGVTLPPPPPDPAAVVARALACQYDCSAFHDLLRDLFPTDAIEAAAAKVQEAGS